MWIALRKSAVLGSASESAALSSDFASHCPDTGPALLRKGKLTPWQRLRRASTKVPWMSALLRRISANSMPDPCGERWTLLLRDSPVSLTPSPGSALEQQMSDGSGRTSRGSSESVEPLACSSKTFLDSSGTPVATILTEGIWMSPQMTLLGDSEKFSGLWPNSGSMRNGVVSERPQWALRTSANEFSFSDTGSGTSDGGASQQWSTPNARDEKNPGAPHGERAKRKAELAWTVDLNDQAAQWATPNVPNGGRVSTREEVEARGSTEKGKRQIGLEMEALYWASPQARDFRSGETIQDYGNARPEDSESCGAHPAAKDSLTSQSAFWEALPQVQPTRSGMTCWCGASGCVQPSHVRKLNPLFVEWLMGWPLYWLTTEPTAFGRPATDAFLSRQRRL